MAKSFLIGLDGTTSSARAVQLGVQWAQQCDALLVGLVVVDEASLKAVESVPLAQVPTNITATIVWSRELITTWNSIWSILH